MPKAPSKPNKPMPNKSRKANKPKPCILANCKNPASKENGHLCYDHSMRILNKKDTKIIPHNAIYIGRPSFWGNPFVIGEDGDREDVLAMHALWLKDLWRNDIGHDQFASRLQELLGKDLVCWCAPLPCHGDTLRKAALWSHGLIDHPPWKGIKKKLAGDKRMHKTAKRTIARAKEGIARRQLANGD